MTRNKIYPYNLVQSLALIVGSSLFALPFLALKLSRTYSQQLENLVLSITFFLALVCISAYKNKSNEAAPEPKFEFKPVFSLPGLIVIACSFQVALVHPLNFFLQKAGIVEPLKTEYDLLLFLSVVVLGPAMEEIIFRGIILRGFLSSYTPYKAILLSSVLFALVHGTPVHMLFAFLPGLFFGYVYYITKSVGTTTIVHSFTNLTGVALSGHFFETSYMPGFLSWPIFISCFYLFCYSLWRLIKFKNEIFGSE